MFSNEYFLARKEKQKKKLFLKKALADKYTFNKKTNVDEFEARNTDDRKVIKN